MIFRPAIYAASIIGLSILLIGIGIVLDRFAGISLPGSVSMVVVPMIAAMIEGQSHVSRTGAAPEKGAMWKAAFLMTMIYLAISTVFAVGSAVVTELNVMDMFTEIDAGIVMIAALVVGLLYFLMSRLGYGMGVRNQLKIAKPQQ